MVSAHLLLLLSAIAAIISQVTSQTPPGLKLTFSQSFIDYGKDWAIRQFLPSLQHLHAPDVHGESGEPALLHFFRISPLKQSQALPLATLNMI
jgi:hypothetical protein